MSSQIFSCLSYIFALFVDRPCIKSSIIAYPHHQRYQKAVDTDEIEGLNIFMFYYSTCRRRGGVLKSPRFYFFFFLLLFLFFFGVRSRCSANR